MCCGKLCVVSLLSKQQPVLWAGHLYAARPTREMHDYCGLLFQNAVCPVSTQILHIWVHFVQG